MNTLQLVLFSTFSLLVWATVIPSNREYLPPTAGRTYYHLSGNSQQYYPSSPVFTAGGYYQPGLVNPNHGHGGAGFIIGANSGQNQYYKPGYAGGVSGQYNPGFGGEYYNPGFAGGAGSGHYYNPSIGGGSGYYNTGFGNGGLFVQGHIGKPGYKPRSVISSDDGYIYGKKK